MAGYNEDGSPRLRYDEGGAVTGYSGMDSGVAAPGAYMEALAKQNVGQGQLLLPTGWNTPGWADWSIISGGNGTRYATMADYYKDLYGGGEVKYANDPNGGNQYAYFDSMGLTPDLSKQLTSNPKDSKLGKLVLAGILATGAAGLGGLLPGTESIFSAGAGAAEAAGAGEFVGGASGGTIAGGASGGGALSGITAAEAAGIGGAGLGAAQAIDGSAQTIFDAAAGAGIPGFDPTLVSGAGGGVMSNIEDWVKKLLTVGGGQANPLSTGLNIFSGLYGLYRGNEADKVAERAAAMQDPFGPYRAQYANQLSALMADPSLLTKMPGYEAGLQAVTRKMASQGYLGSGNMMAALADYGGNFFNQEATRLATLAGANIGPSGGNALISGYGAATDTISKALGSLGFGAKEIAQILANR